MVMMGDIVIVLQHVLQVLYGVVIEIYDAKIEFDYNLICYDHRVVTNCIVCRESALKGTKKPQGKIYGRKSGSISSL